MSSTVPRTDTKGLYFIMLKVTARVYYREISEIHKTLSSIVSTLSLTVLILTGDKRDFENRCHVVEISTFQKDSFCDVRFMRREYELLI